MTLSKPSIIEQLQPLTLPIKQHLVHDFSGRVLDTARWNAHAVNSPASFGHTNGADAGYRITADGGANNEGMLNFNNIRQYSHTGSVAIWVERDVQNTSYTGYCGLANGTTGVDSDFPEIALLYNWSVNTNMGLRTGDASTKSTTESSVALDTNWHCHKIELTSSNVTHTIDGVLETTKTTNRPTAKLQPVAGVFGNGKSIDVRYCEAWNT